MFQAKKKNNNNNKKSKNENPAIGVCFTYGTGSLVAIGLEGTEAKDSRRI